MNQIQNLSSILNIIRRVIRIRLFIMRTFIGKETIQAYNITIRRKSVPLNMNLTPKIDVLKRFAILMTVASLIISIMRIKNLYIAGGFCNGIF